MGHALNGAIASAERAPASKAIAARFQPHARMIARPAARKLPAAVTTNRLRRQGGSLARQGAETVRRRWRRGVGLRVALAGWRVPCAWRSAVASPASDRRREP